MLLRRLVALGRTAAASGRLRRSLSTAASHPSRAIILDSMPACESVSVPPLAVGASAFLAEPPRDSFLFVPKHLLNTSALPESDGGGKQLFLGHVRSATGDGLLLLSYLHTHTRVTDLRVDKQTREAASIGLNLNHVPDITRLVCNPVTGELFRLPDIDGSTKIRHGGLTNTGMGLLTQADSGHGPPDRYAVVDFVRQAEVGRNEFGRNWVVQAHRFLSETRKWDTVVSAPCKLPRARAMMIEQDSLASGGRIWWVDLTWGAISLDPFDNGPEPRFVELPRGSLLPERTDGGPVLRRTLARYRRMGVSEGRLRYAEVSQREPFVLSSFALDEEGGDWTLEHRVALSRVWADGGYPWLPLQGKETPQIDVLDPLNANVMHLTVGEHFVVVDMHIGKVVGSYFDGGSGRCCIPCVLPPWLGSSRIPSAGKKNMVKNKTFVGDDSKKNLEKNKTLADILVRSDKH